MQNFKILLFFLLFTSVQLFAQNGGNGVFQFLNLPNSSRTAALGMGYQVAPMQDISVSFINPSLLSTKQKNTALLNYSNYVSDINLGALQYNLAVQDIPLSATLLYINYGSFNETNISGEQTGNTFSGGDYLLNIGIGHNWNKQIYYGLNFKTIYGAYDIYRSFALAADASITYQDTVNNFSGGIILKNMGYQLKPFNNQRENLPFEIALAISQKLKYAPFRYHITYNNLQQFDLTFQDLENPDNQIDLVTGEPIAVQYSKAQKLMRHFIFGLELMLSDAFQLQSSYNVRRNQELSISNTGGAPGLSFGFALQLKRLSFSYAHSRLNVAGGNNFFTLQLKPSIFNTKK
ncbi:type IX secretion system protein PorQ [Pedobacter glucosidilyticus]|uniref:type IX secretion system protein PorQ n=1 Tax=Pedobacter glucosidilyticus TaxID=1122941 RepID=UPI000428A677|nr:type IX secretion system protein PorQ [Pedobacter glucosidilyticus]